MRTLTGRDGTRARFLGYDKHGLAVFQDLNRTEECGYPGEIPPARIVWDKRPDVFTRTPRRAAMNFGLDYDD